jgi:toxin ParE1/3/4
MKLYWSRRAQHDLLALQEFVRQKPSSGEQIADALGAACDQIIAMPHSGRLGRVEGTREIVLTGTPFILAYKVFAKRATILAIVHGARRWPKTL